MNDYELGFRPPVIPHIVRDGGLGVVCLKYIIYMDDSSDDSDDESS